MSLPGQTTFGTLLNKCVHMVLVVSLTMSCICADCELFVHFSHKTRCVCRVCVMRKFDLSIFPKFVKTLRKFVYYVKYYILLKSILVLQIEFDGIVFLLSLNYLSFFPRSHCCINKCILLTEELYDDGTVT